MTINFLLLLLCLTVFTGLVTVMDYLLRGRKKLDKTIPVLLDYSRSLFPIFLIVLLLRSFLGQPFKIPSGSLEPTVVPGDFVIVNQYDYGVFLPVWRKKIISVGAPRRGQIALFHWPVNTNVNFIKRVIGVPGDSVSYIDKVLYINGKKMPQQYVGDETIQQNGVSITMSKYQEDLNGIKHNIYVCSKAASFCPAKNHDFYHLKVPQGQYLMMGDNRDDSDDGRDWGFVPEGNFIGRALMIWFSWDSKAGWLHKIRWRRIGQSFP